MCAWGVEGGQGWWRGAPEWVRWRRWIVLWFINSSKSLVLFSTAARGTTGSSLHVHQNGSVTFFSVWISETLRCQGKCRYVFMEQDGRIGGAVKVEEVWTCAEDTLDNGRWRRHCQGPGIKLPAVRRAQQPGAALCLTSEPETSSFSTRSRSTTSRRR